MSYSSLNTEVAREATNSANGRSLFVSQKNKEVKLLKTFWEIPMNEKLFTA